MKRSKRGFTLVEVVLAVVIAVLVSVAAASVILATRSGTNAAVLKSNAVSQASAILECFKAADNFSEFNAGLDFVYDTNFSMSGAEKKVFSFYFDKATKPISTESFYSPVTLEKCHYVIYVELDNCERSGSEYLFKNNTTCDIKIFESRGIKTELNPFDSGSDYADHETELVYEMEKAYRKGSVD
ncbi:MAG: prepilin-type N-terminal cleavage/methylation domain-containing protein [Clostridia bacterium]|nr:prepilin-type N-terminal cleavage/methylation domain-containing protein [Clostridia bacterium]